MKRIITLLLLCLVALSLCCCSQDIAQASSIPEQTTSTPEPTKSVAIQQAEEAINRIGEVTIDSGAAIKEAEKYYNILTDGEKAQVSNRLTLAEAKEAYETLLEEEEEKKQELAFNNAKEAFDKLNEAAQLCINGMDDVYGAWHFGIYDADDYSSSTVALMLSLETILLPLKSHKLARMQVLASRT